jgi:hypothetical protein
MGYGKSLHRVMRDNGMSVNTVKLFYNKDGSPLTRAEPKIRMSKKERLRLRRKGEADGE